ncbi:MAG: ribbon-helix-helix protein, CopG family, partial [Gammaproteobacteria bacterium]
MTTVSIRLPDELLKETEKRARELRIPRAEYIRRAIESLNATAIAQRRRRRITEASQRVRKESM